MGRIRVLVGKLAVLMSRRCVVLRLLVLTEVVVVRRLMVVMGGGVVMRGGLVVVLAGLMRRRCQWSFLPCDCPPLITVTALYDGMTTAALQGKVERAWAGGQRAQQSNTTGGGLFRASSGGSAIIAIAPWPRRVRPAFAEMGGGGSGMAWAFAGSVAGRVAMAPQGRLRKFGGRGPEARLAPVTPIRVSHGGGSTVIVTV